MALVVPNLTNMKELAEKVAIYVFYVLNIYIFANKTLRRVDNDSQSVRPSVRVLAFFSHQNRSEPNLKGWSLLTRHWGPAALVLSQNIPHRLIIDTAAFKAPSSWVRSISSLTYIYLPSFFVGGNVAFFLFLQAALQMPFVF